MLARWALEISAKPAHTSARQRSARNRGGKLIIRHGLQAAALDGRQTVPRRPVLIRVCGHRVPGTDLLADVATKQVVADRRALTIVKWAAIFDREIGHTLCRIEHPRLHKCLRRTCIETQRACAALINGR